MSRGKASLWYVIPKSVTVHAFHAFFMNYCLFHIHTRESYNLRVFVAGTRVVMDGIAFNDGWSIISVIWPAKKMKQTTNLCYVPHICINYGYIGFIFPRPNLLSPIYPKSAVNLDGVCSITNTHQDFNHLNAWYWYLQLSARPLYQEMWPNDREITK